MAKQIPLRVEKVEVNGRSVDFSYIATIKTVLSSPGADGFSIEEIAQSMKIVNKIESSNGSKVANNVTLEDADWTYLKDRIGKFRWGVAHNGILNLRDAVNNAKNIDI